MDPRVRCVAVDLETTGLIPGHDRIVEIGAVAFSPAGGVASEYSELVNPGIPIPRAASRVSGITDDMVNGRPAVCAVLPSFLAFLGDAVPVAHNAAFDVGFLAADAARLALAAPSTPVIDTRALARAVAPGRRSYSLEALFRDLGLVAGSAHRALADAHSCRMLFLACLERLDAAGAKTDPADLAAIGGPVIDLAARAPSALATVVALSRAIERGADMEIAYESAAKERTFRRIQPLSFSIVGGAAAVVAFCRLRGARRTFLVDSIREIKTV
jgi:DNA polymerase III subunit epsilon